VLGPTDADLIARVIGRDDRHAFAQLVRRHQSNVRGLLRRLTCGDLARADDLAQEAFLRAYRGIGSFRGGARFSSWIYRIAYNVFLSDAGRAGPAPGASERLDTDEGPPTGSPLLRHDLDQALAALPPVERLAVVLSYKIGATHEEIAVVLGCPLGTAKSHVLRARERMRYRLSDWNDETRDATHG
jgi:RNA polymerase sigma factor (sigma-70 family)